MSALAYLVGQVWDDELYSLWATGPETGDEIWVNYPLTVRRTDGVDEALTVRQVLRLARQRISANSHRAAAFANLADLASGELLDAAVQFRSDGTAWAIEGGALTQLANWYWPTTAGAGAGFEIQFITTAAVPAAAGSATPPAFLPMSINRSAAIARGQAAGAGVNTATVAYNIRRAGQASSIASGSIELRTEIEAAPAGGGGSLGTLTVEEVATRPNDAPDAAIGAIQLNTDGTITYTGSGSGGASNWHTPTTGGIGSSRWVKFTLASGTAWDAGLAAGTVYALSSARQLQWMQSTAGSRAASVTVQIYSDAGGTALVSTGTVSAFVSLTLTGGGA
jgi:hypothetical protein